MKDQELILKELDSFNLKHIFECGQCFRWNKISENKYVGVVKNNVIQIEEYKNLIKIQSFGESEIEELVYKYFDIARDYKKIKESLNKLDDKLKPSLEYGYGIRILNQELWETIISFIISANNNIPRIKKIIEKICKKYGKRICWNNKEYFLFPTPEQLSKATIEDLRGLGLGFRDKRIFETTKMILNKEVNLEKLYLEKDTVKVREELLKLPGVGPKVADCILLFSDLKRLEVFPIDVWVRRVMNEIYIKNEDEIKVRKAQILNIAKEKFGDLSGIAQQYLFYWKREN